MSTFIITIFLHVNIKLHINMMIVQFDIIYLAGGGGVRNMSHIPSSGFNCKTVYIHFQNKRDRILGIQSFVLGLEIIGSSRKDTFFI